MWTQLTPEQLKREYSPSSLAPGFMGIVAKYEFLSEDVLKNHEFSVCQYGEYEDERVIIFEARASESPALLVFIHGGYWQELSAKSSCFPADELLQNGVSYAAVDYTLAPQVTLGEIAAQCIKAVATVATEFRRRHPGARVVACGSSAGAHLSAMLMTVDWTAQGEVLPFDAAILLSGVYDLRPLVSTYINEKLGLDLPTATQLSPQLLDLCSAVPTIICWGEYETDEFKRQSREFAERVAQHHQKVRAYEVAGKNHFDIVFEFAKADSRLGNDTLELLQVNPHE